MPDVVQIACPQCHRGNRVPVARQGEAPVCGACRAPLWTGGAIGLGPHSFEKHLRASGIPVIVDFWASWCGPCQSMAPQFQQAAAHWEGKVRFAKLNTEEAPQLSTQFGIRSIPTLILFSRGNELARISGALSSPQIDQWIQQALAKQAVS